MNTQLLYFDLNVQVAKLRDALSVQPRDSINARLCIVEIRRLRQAIDKQEQRKEN